MAVKVVGLAVGAAGGDLPKSCAMVSHVEPVLDFHAVAADGDSLAVEHLLDDDRDELLGELERAVVARSVGDNRRKA